MLKRTTQIILAIFTILPMLVPANTFAVNVFERGCQSSGAAGGSSSSSSSGSAQICGAATDQKDELPEVLKNVINTLLYVLGIIAVIMIIIGGIRYTTSNGDAQQITSAKNTVLYSVIGLVVGIVAFAIVNFVVEALK